jgi:hypothetical protein
MAQFTSYKSLGNDIYAGPPPTPDILKYLKTINVKNILCVDKSTDKKIKENINQAGFGDIYTQVGISGTEFARGDVNYLKNNIKNIFSKRPIYVYSSVNTDQVGFVIALYKIIGMNQSAQAVIDEIKNKLNFGKVGTNTNLYQSWETYLKLLDPKNKDKSVETESGTEISPSSSAADDGEFKNNLNDLISNIYQINNLPNPSEHHKMTSFAPFESIPYYGIGSKVHALVDDYDSQIQNMIQMGTRTNGVPQTIGRGPVEGEGFVDI